MNTKTQPSCPIVKDDDMMEDGRKCNVGALERDIEELRKWCGGSGVTAQVSLTWPMKPQKFPVCHTRMITVKQR